MGTIGVEEQIHFFAIGNLVMFLKYKSFYPETSNFNSRNLF